MLNEQQLTTKIFLDLETGDPDDILTLIYCLGIEEFEIVGITLWPGSQQQIDLVRFILKKFKMEIPIGSYDCNKPFHLPIWYLRAFGKIPITPTQQVDAYKLMLKICDENTILFTGGPNKNLGKALSNGKLKLKSWFAQGGFAGDNIVPTEYILPKFKGRITYPTWNFGNSIEDTKIALDTKDIPIKYICSKNVCHNVLYNSELHYKLKIFLKEKKNTISRKYISLKLFYDVMEQGYPKSKTKKLHDLLPVICIRNISVCEWAQVELFTNQNGKILEWGSIPSENSNTFICINYDREKFIQYFFN